MTGREMLTLFARLRGMNSNEIEDEVIHWISEVGIEEYADRKCGTYSGGNKRKLNVAQALVADPPIGSTISTCMKWFHVKMKLLFFLSCSFHG